MAHNIVVIVGSLRKEAFSLKVANALAKLAPATNGAGRGNRLRAVTPKSSDSTIASITR